VVDEERFGVCAQLLVAVGVDCSSVTVARVNEVAKASATTQPVGDVFTRG
jgi:hypothetical protein